MISMCACCGLYGERIEYCGPLVRAGTQYNATTCPARAGLIPTSSRPSSVRLHLSRTRGVDPAAGSHTLGSRDHLRVCGAVWTGAPGPTARRGLSPRVRSGLSPLRPRPGCTGIISACAERSRLWLLRPRLGRDHLRVCGAVSVRWRRCRRRRGSSPRVRSGQRSVASLPSEARIISACAERSSPPAYGATT